MLALLRQRRWVGFTLLAVFFALLFVRLSFWQVSRLHERQRANDVVRTHLAAAPMTWAELTRLAGQDHGYAADQQWRSVRVSGHWDTGHQVLVRNKPSDSGDNGYEVVTPLLPDGGGPAVLVDRGWVSAGRTPAAPDAVPAAQPDSVTIVARVEPAEPSRPTGGLPPGQVSSLSTADLSRGDGYPVVDGYLRLVSESPAPASAPTVHADPVLDDGPHLSYAVQWVLFALVAVGGWWTFLRREADEAGTPQPVAADGAHERAEAPTAP